MHRTLLLAILSTSLLTSSLPAATDLTGTWSGTYSAIASACTPPQHQSGNLSGSLTQSGSSLSGVIVVEINSFDCKPISPSVSVGIPITGTVSGNSFTFTFLVDVLGAGSGSGSVSGNTMTITFSIGDVSGTATLTQTSTSPPTGGLSGAYSGTWTNHWKPCGGPFAPYTANASGSLTQTGSTLSGILYFEKGDNKDQGTPGNCVVTFGPDPIPVFLSGQISGNSISGTVTALSGNQETEVFTGGLSGNTIQASFETDNTTGEFIEFTISKTSSTVAPAIASFSANPSSITAGQTSTLSWSTLNATSVSIDNGIGAQAIVGSITVKPATTTTYTLTATGAGTATAKVTVTVGAGAPNVAVSSFPHGMVQAAGQAGGTDSFALTNVGTAATDLTLSPSGSFFTISPTSFNLAAGATQTVSVTGTPQAANSYEGSVSVNGSGASGITIPIRLLSATPPTGTVTAAPTVARSDVSAPAGQNPSGSVNFTNSGSSMLQGIAVSDVPWIIPQSGVITIQPGQTQAITFTIDSSKRPDASSPLGGVTGKISLVFISGATSGKTALAVTPTANVSVTIVYVVVPGISAASPPALNAGELALFVPGMQNRAKAGGDLLIANKLSSGSLNDLKVYFQGSGVPSQVASLPQIGANGTVALPGLLKSVFATAAQSGTAQIRSADVTKVAVGALQFNTSAPAGTYGTALPVFRSDRGIGAGGQMIIAGVDKESGSIQTDLYVQELTGNAATIQIDFLGVDGSVFSSRAPDSLPPFGFLEIIDAVPDFVVAAVRIKNTSSGAAKIAAYGLVINPKSGDRWVVNDPVLNAQPSDDTLIIPLTSAGAGAENDFWATNRTAISSSITLDIRSSGRRHAVGAHGQNSSPANPNAVTTSTLKPYGTLLSLLPGGGYVRVSSAANAMSAVARSTIFIPGTGVIGTALPALPPSAGVAAGELKRFAGVEDASQTSRSSATPGTYRTSLVLIEGVNQPATVRVTLRYSFVAGSTVSAASISSKEYSLSASQYMLITDVARDVIGSARDSFGDLHNMELDIEVTGGSGRVLPFLQSIDNGSGDVVMRTD